MAAPVEVPEGLPQPDPRGTGRVDPYKNVGTVFNLDDDDEEPLWTELMTHCDCVASYNTETKVRSLAHLPGGNFAGIADQMVPYVDHNTVVIVSNGMDVLRPDLERRAGEFKRELDRKVTSAGNRPPGDLVMLYTTPDEDKPKGLKPGTFALEVDGRYGRINPTLQPPQQQDQTQGQTTSQGMPGGGETTSRGLPGVAGGGNQGNGRGGTGKGGFWRMLFCCCMPLGHLGGGARRSRGTERREKKKSGIWRTVFCCCSK